MDVIAPGLCPRKSLLAIRAILPILESITYVFSPPAKVRPPSRHQTKAPILKIIDGPLSTFARYTKHRSYFSEGLIGALEVWFRSRIPFYRIAAIGSPPSENHDRRKL